jgi:hypothetical protein
MSTFMHQLIEELKPDSAQEEADSEEKDEEPALLFF